MALNLQHSQHSQPHWDTYDDLLADLQQAEDHFDGTGDHPATCPQRLTPASTAADLFEPNMDLPNSQSPSEDRHSSTAQFHHMDRDFSPHGYADDLSLDMSTQQAMLMNQASMSQRASNATMFSQATAPQNLHAIMPTFNWQASIEEAAQMQYPQSSMAEVPTFNQNIFQDNASFDGSSTATMTMSALRGNAANDTNLEPGAEADAMAHFTNVLNSQSTLQSPFAGQDEPFGTNDQAAIRGLQHLAQPQALHGSDLGHSNPVSRMQVQAEAMGEPVQYRVQRVVSQGSAHPSASDPTYTPPSPESQSPDSVIGPQFSSADALAMYQQQHYNPDSRRPSATSDLAHNMNHHFNLQTSQSSEDLSAGTNLHHIFKRPSLPVDGQSTSLAQRRRQQGPGTIKTSRPTALALNRTVSSSAVNQLHNSTRFPVSPNHTLRRNKSSQVILGNGRVQKSGNNSARNSPMLATFNEPMSSQTTPQPPLNTAVPLRSPIGPQSPHQQFADSQAEPLPSSSSTSMFTPGIHSGSLPGHSFANTPVTTPYGFGPQHQMAFAALQPASDIPQSAPAHVDHFPRDFSPNGAMTSMPPTPANTHFPQGLRHMPSFQGQMMGHPPVHVLPSQHGVVSDAMNSMLVHSDNMHFTGIPFRMAQGISADTYGYNIHDNFLHGIALPLQRELDVKLDMGCEQIKIDAAEGKTTLLPIDCRGDQFTFQNLSQDDMERQLANKR